MADITSGRARRMLSVGRLTTAVGGSYLWQAVKRPFQSASRTERALLETHIRNAERVVGRSKELRGAFMKLAQMLSMRTDLFPAEALEVLSVVQSAVPPMPWPDVCRVLTEELGAPPEKKFRRFDPQAFAAASLGQVHRAELASGAAVAVKVQYPGVAATVHQDVRNVKALLRVFTGIARDVMRQDVDPGEVAAELEARLQEELDYLHEAANLELFRRLLADDPEVMIPRVHRALTTRRVLTMEYLEGYPIQDILAPGVDREMKDWVAVKLFTLLWRQVLEFGALHTDPHPGNYLVTYHPKLAILDFGSIRIFPEPIRRAYHQLARAILAGDRATMADCFVRLDFLDRDDDPEPVFRIMSIVFEPVLDDQVSDPRDYNTVERGMEIAAIAFEHRIFKDPGHRVFLARALMGLDAYLKQFGTVTNWHRVFKGCVERVKGE